jgi:hypothetical protein
LITSASIANDVGRKLPLCKRKVNVGATGEAVVIGDQGIQRQVSMVKGKLSRGGLAAMIECVQR